jgi:signal transduction histidine kinase
MEAVSAFFMRNIVYVYFFYGLAFFALGLVVLLESGRTSEFRFARALVPLALFGLVHGAHEWFEMFQIFAAHETGYVAGVPEDLFRIATLVLSFLLLLDFGARLLPGAEDHPRAHLWQVAAMGALWLAAVGFVAWRNQASLPELLSAADVLARYSLAIPGALLAAWALLRERRDFHARGMSAYGQDLLWGALAFTIYGLAQIFTRPSLVFPSQTINTAFFLRTFGIPVQLLRGLAAVAIAITLGRALRAFEQEGRLRLARANKARIEAQAATLVAQQRRASEVEALNIQLAAGARELSALVEMSRILTSTMDRRRLLDNALYQIVHSFERACCSIIFLKRGDGGLELAGEYRRPQAPLPLNPPPLTAVAADAVTLTGHTGAGLDGVVRVLDDDAFADGITYRTLGSPLLTKGQVFGSLALSSVREEEPFGEPELRLLDAFAGQIATALENAQLYSVLQERETQLEELVRQLVDTQEQERARIARELHDETGQKLTALAMGLAAVESALPSDASQAQPLVRDLREVSDSAITELRRLMADLRPAQLDDLGLLPALRWYIGQYNGRHPELAVTLNAERLPKRLPAEHETVLFRAVQEALTNVARHAHATQATIELHQEARSVRLTIGDNGMGFDVNAPPKYQRGSGLGLVGMRERVSLVGGTCAIESAPGQGTRIVIELPVKEGRERAT